MQRWSKCLEDRRRGPNKHPRKLSDAEKAMVISVACSEEYRDYAPGQIIAKLADKGEYVASEKTFYRILKSQNLLTHRSRAKEPERHEKEATIAAGPNMVWCWDITNLRSREKGVYFKLYMFEDLYSRKIVGWDVLQKELSECSGLVFEAALRSEKISGQGLRLHADNGNPMRGLGMLDKMLMLGVRPSFSRPNVSNDNAFIESLFKTMKYTPMYPTKPFISLDAAKTWVKEFVIWYNSRLHPKLNYISPEDRHQKLDEAILVNRRNVYAAARSRHPLRWSRPPKGWAPPPLAKLNPHGTRMVN
jgi:putative transposase